MNDILVTIMFLIPSTISILILGFMNFYFIFKYKTIYAIAYWNYASKKEFMIVRIGYIGLFLSIIMSIIMSIIGNMS